MIFAVLFCFAAAPAAGAGTITVDVPSGPVPVGVVTTIPVTIHDVGDLGAFSIYVYNNVPGTSILINESRLPLSPYSGSLKDNGYVFNSNASRTYQVATWCTLQGCDFREQELFYIDVLPTEESVSPVSVDIRLVELFSSNIEDITDQYTVVNGTLSVYSPVVSSLVISPQGDISLQGNESIQLTAAVYDRYGIELSADILWFSDDETVVSVNGDGLCSAFAAGTASVSAVCNSSFGYAMATSFITVCDAPPVVEPDIGVGEGTLATLITTAEQLNAVRNDPASSYRLAADIDLSGYGNWIPIGNASVPFTGSFDGGGYTISGLSVHGDYDYAGLFGSIASAEISNVVLTGVNISLIPPYDMNTFYSAGGLSGDAFYSTIVNCTVDGRISASSYSMSDCYHERSYHIVGGLVGKAYMTTIHESSSSGLVSSAAAAECFSADMGDCGWVNSFVGGLVGQTMDSHVSASYSIASVSSSVGGGGSMYTYAGGLIGYSGDSSLYNCYAVGTAKSGPAGCPTGYMYSCSGGLVAEMYGGGIENCYASGTGSTDGVRSGSASLYRGGLVGTVFENAVIKAGVALSSEGAFGEKEKTVSDINVYALGAQTTPDVSVSSADAVTQSFYESIGWDFVNVWTMDASISQYPVLRMQSGSDPIVPPTPVEVFSGGSGTADDPYLISSAAELVRLAELVNAGNAYVGVYFLVTGDIALSGMEGTPIGMEGTPFRGIFDGGARNISGLTITDGDDHCGLFGYVSDGAVITRVHLVDVDISSSDSNGVGGLVGKADAFGSCYVTIQDCYATGRVSSSDGRSGGLVGWVYASDSGSVTIQNCSARGNVSSTSSADYRFAGGLVGWVGASDSGSVTIQNCSAAVGVSSTSPGGSVGGLAGRVYVFSGSVTIQNCSASGNSSSSPGGDVGGLVGLVDAFNSGSVVTLENCYATGGVSSLALSPTYFLMGSGGLVGRVYASGSCSVTIHDNYATGGVSSLSSSSSSNGGVGGLVGWVYLSSSSVVTLEDCVALSPTVISPSKAGRLIECSRGGGTAATPNTYALSTMSAGTATDGIYVSPADAVTQSFYESIGWDFVNVWTMDASISQYPVLRMQSGSDPIVIPTPVPTPAAANITEILNTTESWNAVTPIAIGYELTPSLAGNLTVPEVFLRPWVANIHHHAEKIIAGGSTKISASINADGSIILSDDVSDADLLRITFTGRCLGDITGDGKVETADKIKIGQHLSEKTSLDSDALFYADINRDGEVDVGDKIKLGQYVAEVRNADYAF